MVEDEVTGFRPGPAPVGMDERTGEYWIEIVTGMR
jgi:hypothetical protein